MAPATACVRAQWRLAKQRLTDELSKPRSEAAYAVQLAHERTGMRIRQQVERGVGAPQVAVIVMPPAAPKPTAEQRKKAPVIDVGGEK